MARLVYGGVFDKYPDIRFVTHHLGGMIPYYGKRIEAFHNMLDDFIATGLATGGDAASAERITANFRRFYNDTAVAGSGSALVCGLDYFGPEHLLFGSDFPFGPGGGEGEVAAVLRSVRNAGLGPSAREAILSGNVLRVLGVDQAT
jgi:aminocarboxymuconate-semialdehyde decarboxylase